MADSEDATETAFACTAFTCTVFTHIGLAAFLAEILVAANTSANRETTHLLAEGSLLGVPP
jgi:hypothetical protein